MMTFSVIVGRISDKSSDGQKTKDKIPMADTDPEFQLPDTTDPNSSLSSASEQDPAIVIAAQFERHAQELLEVLRKALKVGDGIVEVSDDPEIEARKKEQEARREEMKRTIEEIRNLPYEERTKRLKAYVKAFVERPSLLAQVHARLQAEEQRERNDELLSRFGQGNHTSIN